MGTFAHLLSEGEYLKDVHSCVVTLAPNRAETYWSDIEEKEDQSAKLDIGRGIECLIGGGLDRPRAQALCHTLRYLDVGSGSEDAVSNFARSLRGAHAAVARAQRAAGAATGPGPFEIVASLTDPLVSERILELELAALMLAVRWLAPLGYATDVRLSALTIIAIGAGSTLRERTSSLAQLFAPPSPIPAVDRLDAITGRSEKQTTSRELSTVDAPEIHDARTKTTERAKDPPQGESVAS
jgi:hypothetical protein